mgnify:CR=1 FL=1
MLLFLQFFEFEAHLGHSDEGDFEVVFLHPDLLGFKSPPLYVQIELFARAPFLNALHNFFVAIDPSALIVI